jgi:hypothetical protein
MARSGHNAAGWRTRGIGHRRGIRHRKAELSCSPEKCQRWSWQPTQTSPGEETCRFVAGAGGEPAVRCDVSRETDVEALVEECP